MKKILISLIVLVFAVIIFYLGIDNNCDIQKRKIYKKNISTISKPAVKAIYNYTINNKNIFTYKNIDNFPYVMKSCRNNIDIKECRNNKDKYYYIYNDNIYIFNLTNDIYNGYLSLSITYKCEKCIYTIYKDNKLFMNYQKGECIQNMHHSTWFRQ